MIAYLQGEIVLKMPDSLVMDVGGVGYEVLYDPASADQFPAVGSQTRIWTYLHVREDAQVLYGFPHQEIRSLFSLLLTVSGVGPKVAGTIVASLSPERFALAILGEDWETLTSIKGIGKKGAQRLVLELKDKLKKAMPQMKLSAESNQVLESADIEAAAGDVLAEALSALLVLGYRRPEAEKALQKAWQESREGSPDLRVEDLIKSSLRLLSVI